MKHVIFLYLCSLIVLGCSQNNHSSDNYYLVGDTLYINKEYLKTIPDAERKQLFIDTGNSIFLDSEDPKYERTFEQAFIYELIAVNKYNGSWGSTAFHSLCQYHFPYSHIGGELILDSLDLDSRNFILDNLEIGYKRGDPLATAYLGEYYIWGDGVSKNIELGQKMKHQTDSIYISGLKEIIAHKRVIDNQWFKIKIK
jgi:hypothetical protein